MRTLAPEITLHYARQWTATAGVSEVTNITDLDVLGVPVFVSVRPHARAERYTFGKGLQLIDAEVAAHMEALEFYFADPSVADVATFWGTPRSSSETDDAILKFAPLLQREIDLDGRLLLGKVEELESEREWFIPAELIYYPAPDVGQQIFGSSTNGLASGNTVREATIQALLELIERDIWSFEFVQPQSRLVDPVSLPDAVSEIVERAEKNGLQLKIRAIANDYGLPFFAAFIFDLKNPSRQTFNGGWACDLSSERALVRAVTEAAQSRLAFIHGGRKVPRSEDEEMIRQHMLGVSDTRQQVQFSEIPDVGVAGDLQKNLDVVIERLRRVVREPIYRVELTSPDAPFHVVRVVVPLLENLKENRVRVGPRLKASIEIVGSTKS